MMNRRTFVQRSSLIGAGTILGLATGCASPKSAGKVVAPKLGESDLIVAAVKGGLERSLYPVLHEQAYPGHFMVTADGGYGAENTWPGLDAWQSAGAYLLVGKVREVLDYFDFVQASQRSDGNIPFAIFPGERTGWPVQETTWISTPSICPKPCSNASGAVPK